MKELLPLLSVMIGGLLAITGGVLGNYFSNKFAQRRTENDRKIEKLEEIVKIAYSVVDYERFRMSEIIEGNKPSPKDNPVMEMSSLIMLYFPDLVNHEVKIRFALVGCRDAGIAFIERTKNIEKNKLLHTHTDDWNVAFKNLNEVVISLATDARKFIPR